MVDFHKRLLGHQPCTRTSMKDDILKLGPHLTMKQQVQICKPLTKEDVKKAIFSIAYTKFPGPNGFSNGFFKQAWSKIKDLVCSAVLNFFETGSLPHYVSATKLLVLPKVQHP